MRRFQTYGPNRYVCSVLDDMRKLDETRNYSLLGSLIEEIQVMVNRMEAALEDQRDIKAMNEHRSKLKAEIRRLEKRMEDLDGFGEED